MPPPKVTAVVPVIMQSRHGTACQQHRKSASRVAERVARLPNYRRSRDLIVVNTIWVEKLIAWARARPAYINPPLPRIASHAYSQRGRPG
jgi:hypothetical protein